MNIFKRISNLIQGFLGLFVSGMERQNPRALLEVEKENLRAQIAKYNQGLASQAGLSERLKGQVANDEKEAAELKARTTAHLRAGNREKAGDLALQLQNLTRRLEENRKQLDVAESTYKDLVKARDVTVDAAKSKIEALKYSIGDMEIKKATAEMTEMASGMISSIGGSGDNLNRLQEMVEEDRNKAAGRARVARDSLNMDEFTLKESEQDALADQALADFAASAGIALDPRPIAGGVSSDDAASADTAKTMGPISEIN